MDGDDGNDSVILSIRSAVQYAKGRISSAINIPFKKIAKVENLKKLNPDLLGFGPRHARYATNGVEAHSESSMNRSSLHIMYGGSFSLSLCMTVAD